MSTGDFDAGQPNFYQEGFNRPRQSQGQGDGPNFYQDRFNNPDYGDGPNLQQQCWEVPQGQTRNYAFPTDGQGFPVIYNRGTVNIFMAGGNGYDDASVRAMQAAKLADMTSGRWDNYQDNRERYSPDYNRLSDFRREALIRDGQRQDDLYRSSFNRPDPYYDREFNGAAYRRPGQYTSYSHGGRDGLSYYQSGPSYNSMPPWVNDDCFGTGRNGDQQGLRMAGELLRMGLTYDIARRSVGHNQGRWDNGYDRYGDRYDNRMNPIDYMLMSRAINGNNPWNRYSPQIYDQNYTNYTHGGPDGLSFYNSSPAYAQWDGPRSGFEQVLSDVMPLAQTYLAYDIARRSVPRYDSNRNVQPYYRNNDSYSHMAYNQNRQQQLAQQRYDHDAYNAMRRQQRNWG